MRRLFVAIGVSGLAAGVAAGAWWFFVPHALGLSRTRVVLLAGAASADQRRLHVSDVLEVGQTLHTPDSGGACFSIHVSRVCVGSASEARLTAADLHGATIEATRGVVVASARGADVLRVVTPDGSTVVHGSTASIEPSAAGVVVTSLDGSVELQPTGRPATTLVAPSAASLHDGTPRPVVSTVAREELDVVKVAERWQGSAGAVLTVDGTHGSVTIDGSHVGRAPLSVLLDEGDHTLVVRDPLHEIVNETLRLKGGDKQTIPGT